MYKQKLLKITLEQRKKKLRERAKLAYCLELQLSAQETRKSYYSNLLNRLISHDACRIVGELLDKNMHL